MLFFDSPPSAPAVIQFRLAQAADWPGLHQACYSQQTQADTQPLFARALKRQENGQGMHLLACQESNIVGSAQLIWRGRAAELADIVVSPRWRGQGIGTALIQILEAQAAVQEWWPLEIGVESDNRRAYALYLRLGYKLERAITIQNGRTAYILQKESGIITHE